MSLAYRGIHGVFVFRLMRPVLYAPKIDLVRLPHAYTELHAEVISRARGRGSHPAVCLVCGEILEAQGAGECTRHASMCGSGIGVFFLLQVTHMSTIDGCVSVFW